MDINNMLASLFNQQQQAGYDKAKQECNEQIAALQAQIEELKNKRNGTIINVTIDGKQHKTETENKKENLDKKAVSNKAETNDLLVDMEKS